MLYFASLYGQLNLYYNLQEELYTNNQSVINFALGNQTIAEDFPEDEQSGIKGSYQSKSYGLLTVLMAQSVVRQDTVQSAHFVGQYYTDNIAVYLANFTKPLSYFGTVSLVGNTVLPTEYIEASYITNEPNAITRDGKTSISQMALPEINPLFKKIFEGISADKTSLEEVDKPNDSLYYNSFFNPTKEIYLEAPTMSNKIFKGNFILRSKDSLRIQKSCVLEDVILIAPKISFEEGFTGTLQAFATQAITLAPKIILKYPSVVCLYNATTTESKIKIDKESKIMGAVVLFGNPMEAIGNNSIEIAEDGLIMGDIYCSGKLLLKSKVYGSIYTNRFFYKTASSSYDNTIANTVIDVTKKPAYFISIPLFNAQKMNYGIIKKVL